MSAQAATETRITLSDLFRQRKYLKLRFVSMRKYAAFSFRSRRKQNSPIAALIEDNASRYPESVALYYENQKVTYRELNDYANKVGNYLQAQGVKQRDVVVLYMENRIEFLVYMLAVIKLGATASLVNSSQIGESLKHSIDLVSPKAIIVGEELCDKYEEITDLDNNQDRQVYFVPDTDLVTNVSGARKGYVNISEECQSSSSANLDVKVSDEDAGLYIYTSGTTGLPKATIQSNARFKKLIPMSMLLNPLSHRDVLYSTLPLYHGTALACLVSVLGTGASFALRRKFSASEFWHDVAKYKATCFGYVGELCRYLLNTDSPLSKNNTLDKMVGNGLRPDLWMEFKEKFEIDDVRELYSASESTLGSANVFNVDKTVGFLAGTYAIVKYDEETEEPIPNSKGVLQRVKPGEGGLLLGKITKLTPFTGYTQKSKNESKILRNVFKKGDQWFNTGDVVRDVGCRHLQFLDRSGDTFRWKGENVSTSEVEKIVNQYPAVEESVAYGVEVPHATGRAGMVAVKLKDPNEELEGKAFYEYLSSQLPAYAMPLFYRVNDTLERTQTFKYKKAGLKQEGYDPDKVKTAVHVALHSERSYTTVNPDILDDIKENKMKL